MGDSTSIQKWVSYAKNDLLVAKDLHLQNEYVFRAVLTHSQQSVEKYLKAFLLQNGVNVIKTHDLIYLNKLCAEISDGFLNFENNFAWLSVVYIESRYPDDFEDIDKTDAERALNIASAFEAFIKTSF